MNYNVRALFLRKLWKKKVFLYMPIGDELIVFAGELLEYDYSTVLIKQENGDELLVMLSQTMMIGEADKPWYEMVKEESEVTADDDLED